QPQLMDGHLRPVVKDLDHSFDLDEIVAVKGIEDIGYVIPHLGVEFTRTIAKHEREIKLAALLLPNLFGLNKETCRDDLVRFKFGHIRRFHFLSDVLSAAGAGAGAAAGSAGFSSLLVLVSLAYPFGMTHRMCLRRRAATSSLVMVWGLSAATSF